MNEIVLEKVKKIMDSPSCFPGLREIGANLVALEGTEQEEELLQEFKAELERDIEPIEDAIAFFKSEKAKIRLGDQAEPLLAKFEKARAEGEKYCFCPACRTGLELLEIL